MKKMICILLAVLLLAGAAAAASAEGDVSSFRIAAPGGAPALALAVLAAENPENYTFVAAETIAAEFAGETADFIIAPINAGAKLYKAGKSDYRLAAVVSWGNLYFASQKENFKAEDIDGAELVLFGENTINASVALYALEKNGITELCDYVSGSDMNGKMTKQDVIRLCISRLGVSPEETVHIGDTDYDAEGAADTGVDFIAVCYGFGPSDREYWERFNPVAVVDSADEIRTFLEGCLS